MHINIAKIDFNDFNKTKIYIAKIDFAKKLEVAPEFDYMYFKLADGAESGNISYSFSVYYDLHNKYLKISKDGRHWKDWKEEISMVPNVKYFVKGEDDYVRNSNIIGGFFSSDVSKNKFNIECGGNVMSLVNMNENITTNYCFCSLFYDMRNLLTPPTLPATTLADNCYGYMFRGCSSLTQAPALPATILADSCYSTMFFGCSSLTQAPSLPATTLADNCYGYMFWNCTSLTQAPELPATTLTDNCYSGMFYGCSSLVHAPELPATTLSNSCYSNMFYGCSSLTQAPSLPATTLAGLCYSNMFRGCTSLTQAPELPATKLKIYCYTNMFNGCTSLTEAPELPSTTLERNCYDGMFNNANKLNWIKALFNTTPSSTYTSDWVNGVSAQGVFVKSIDSNWTDTGVNAVPTGWKVIYYDKTEDKYYTTKTKEKECDKYGNVKVDYMYFKLADGAESGNVSYKFDEYYNLHNKYLKYSTDGNNWTDWTESISMTPNTKYFVKGEDSYVRNSDIYDGFFSSDVSKKSFNIECGGDVMSLCNNVTEITVPYCLVSLFNTITNLVTAPKLSATTFADYCYKSMFNGCSKLVQAPELPATTLADHCYYRMFQNCRSLTQAPALPATTLANGCYNNMFYYCKSLTQAPALPATTLADSCYGSMFGDCSKLTKAPELPATTLANYCYFFMFSRCSKLTKAPELPATTLASSCYDGMFKNCTSLTEITLNGDFNSSYATDWVSNVSPSGTFYNNSDLDIPVGVNGIPAGWKEIRPVKADYMYFKLQDGAESGNVSYKFDEYYNLHNKYLKISTDANNWTDWTEAISMAPNVKYYVKGEDDYVRNSNKSVGFFTSDVSENKFNIECGGNIMSLVNMNESITATGCFSGLFSYMRNLLTAPELPATTLAASCYFGMFFSCSSLTQAPSILPATTLTSYCYYYMFNSCFSLTEAPELPATTLADYCYQYMFNNTSNLNWIKALFTTTPINTYTGNWVGGVSAEGVFVKNINATWTDISNDSVPHGWTVIYFDTTEDKYYTTKTKEVECDKYGNPL